MIPGRRKFSGIFSNTFADGKFGVAITASYQDRHSGYNQAGASSGFQRFMGDQGGWGAIPQPGDPGSENIVNRPGPSDVYSVPQNMLYSFNDVQRERTNGQLTLQFAPTDTLTATLDYTYSEQEAQFQRAELSGWFNFGPSASSWTDGPVAGPITYSEFIPAATNDVGTGGANYGAKSENTSVGLNLTWDPSDNLSFELDYHDSDAELGNASPFGTNATLGVVGFYRGDTGVIMNQDFPVMTMQLAPGTTNVDPAQTYISGSSFRNSFQLSEVEQARVGGTFFFDDDAYSLDFGVMSTTVNNRSAFSNVQNDTWGGAGSPADYDDSDFSVDTVRGYFSNMSGSSNQALFNEFLRWDFNSIVQQAGAADNGLGPDRFRASNDFTTDRRTEEKSNAAYVQFNAGFDMGDKPANLALGMRYEQTDVVSEALVPIATGILWTGNNEFVVQKGAPDFTKLKGDYDYWLPSVDFNVEVAENVIIRASYSQTIGRPGWEDIQGGQSLNDLIRIDGGNANQGDPGLLPLESTNFDLSFEWYYGASSYASLSYFKKDIDNYIGITTITATPFDLPHPGQGARFAEADAATGGTGDLTAIRNYIFTNYANTPEVTVTGTDVNGNLTGTILGIAGEDPASTFDIFVPSNQTSETLEGFELAVQHLFGDTGFGVSANYTIVDTDSKFDDMDLNQQFALEGISDSANLIVFFENDSWSTRVAYNWRDEFLSGRFDGNGNPNPNYTEAYGQLDANVAWNFNDDLTVFVEGINITDEYARIHGRGDNVALYVTNTGPRYMIGARYNFR